VSSGELTHILVDIAVTLAPFSANYMPTVLVLDEIATHIDDSGLQRVVERASSRDLNFQTIVAIPTRSTNYDELAQAGAKVVWLKGMPPAVKIA
jgi:recombinational DNA repair ATPase RecF